MYDALGKRNRRPGFVKAVIAARFEISSQAFDKLCSTFSPLARHFPESEAQTKVLEDSLARFITWGYETGAKDHELDYKLRKSKDLHDTVVQTLEELQSALDEGTCVKSLNCLERPEANQ